LGEKNGRWFSASMNSVAQIRKDLEGCIGKKVILRANRGRKKTTVKEGVLESAYPNLFVVRICNQYDSTRMVSYTYSDVLTSTVEVTICDETDRLIKIS
jgi:uncharacterized protein Veg